MMDRIGGLVHKNRDFCGRENKIVASVHKKSRSDGQPLTEIDSRGWTKGTKQRSEPFGVARAVCFERLAGIFASRDACRPSLRSQNRELTRKRVHFLPVKCK